MDSTPSTRTPVTQTELPVILPKAPTPRAVPSQRHTTPLAGRHVLMVGINYAPEPTGIAPYTTGMADHLAGHARSVTVLTGMPHYPNWQLEPQYRFRLRSNEIGRQTGDAFDGLTGSGATGQAGGLTIRRLRHYVPARQTAARRAGYELTFLLNCLTTRIEQRPDVVLAVTPALGGAVAAAQVARRTGARLIVVVQDLMAKAASQSGISGGGRVAQATAAVERHALRRADLVAVVSESFREQLLAYGVPAERIRLLPNWTHIRASDLSKADARDALGWPREPFTVVHTGNIGLKQDLGNLVEAARICAERDAGVRFVIVGDGSQREAVRAQARGLRNLHFVEPLDGVRYPQSLAAADLLVVNERPGVGDMSLPSKLTSYLTAGRAVIAAVGPEGATSAELRRTNGAAHLIAPGDPAALAEGVLALRGRPGHCNEMGLLGRVYAEANLGREAAAARLDALIEECLQP
ncbi:glycosyltransferase [Kineosporia rhizophila]|uniref:glycosyltransferase n=1 Tax=Kineosporia TaxID=49184 RepID=UPI001E49AA4C|nr:MULTISPECIES: glycosyltransferase [Kineosporia]MCE0537112.1 glycosyltransferase [Kineosporia rhizophila]GLY16043.1 glycosyltransferase WbuB [Kineosporia sp. NBRC 101677]